jgi:hypothetical protein
MKKKLVLALLMATMFAGGAFAQLSLSVGGGGTFSANFLNYAWTGAGKTWLGSQYLDPMSLTSTPTDYYDQNFIGGGFFAFFDATFVMVSLGFNFYGVTYANKDRQKPYDDAKKTFTLSTFDISLFGRLPFSLGALKVFPLLGADLKIAMTYDGIDTSVLYDSYVSEHYTSIWLKLGFGVDIPLGYKLYLRPSFLYGFGFLPKVYQNDMDRINTSTGSGGRKVDVILHGLDLNVAVGYMFR